MLQSLRSFPLYENLSKIHYLNFHWSGFGWATVHTLPLKVTSKISHWRSSDCRCLHGSAYLAGEEYFTVLSNLPAQVLYKMWTYKRREMSVAVFSAALKCCLQNCLHLEARPCSAGGGNVAAACVQEAPQLNCNSVEEPLTICFLPDCGRLSWATGYSRYPFIVYWASPRTGEWTCSLKWYHSIKYFHPH